jgi:hypothetical protein
MPDLSENRRVATLLREAADLLVAQGANPFRAGAYRRAADTLARLDAPVRALFDERGREGLETLSGIGRGLASSIAEILITGQWAQLRRLRGESDPEKLLRLVPGIGERRAAAICASLTAMLDKRRATVRARVPVPGTAAPPVAIVLDVDREYRERAAAGGLPTIAPRRFNPSGASLLPILHARRGDWHFTALYSNTARAHALGRSRDWVVVYFYDDEHAEGQHTVVTETRGALAGKRVVRGREGECRGYYDTLADRMPA